MKKKLVGIFAAALILCTVFFAACTVNPDTGDGGLDMAAIDAAMSNVKAKMETNSTFLGTTQTGISFMETDGDKTYEYSLDNDERVDERYTSIEGSKKYQYLKDDYGEWFKTEAEGDSASGFSEMTAADFVKSGDYYELSEAKRNEFINEIMGDSLEGATSINIEYLKFKIDSNKVTEMLLKMSMTVFGMSATIDMKATYSGFGTVSITLPQVNT